MKKIAFSIVCLSLLLAACRKDIDDFVPYGSAITELNQLLSDIPSPDALTSFNFSSGIPDTFLNTPSGVRFQILDAENLFENEDGIAIPASTCLDLEIRVTEYLKPSDIIAASIPVQLNGTLAEELTGLIQFEVFCSGSPLYIRTGKTIKLVIPSPNVPTSGQADMNMYYANRDASGAITTWEPNGKDIFYFTNGQLKGFEMDVTQTGLFGGFKFPANTLGRICTDIPTFYTADNTLAFLFFTNGKSALPMAYNSQSKKFCIDGIPVGFPAEVVMISKLGEQWQYASKAILTSADQNVIITHANKTRQEVLDSMRDF